MDPISRDPRKHEPDDLTRGEVALDLFTDRDEPIAAFQAHLNAPKGATLPVLHFYGVGGVGKSLLLRRLRKEVPDRMPWARVDFDTTGMREELRALTSLRIELERHGRVEFGRFDVIRAVLAAKEGGGEEELIPLGPAQKAVVAFLKELPFVGSSGEAAKHLIEGFLRKHPKLEPALAWFGGTQRVLELRDLDRGVLLDQMVEAFAADLSDTAPEREGFACRAVVFLDSYEKLWEATAGPTDPQAAGKDQWVRDLYSCLSHDKRVLMVIAGRDELAWREVDHRWVALREDEVCGCLDVHLIGGLSAADTQRYLAKCEVGGPPEKGAASPLQAAIIECSTEEDGGCLPFYVGLCANIVVQERDAGRPDPEPDEFRGIPRKEVAVRLAGRFLTSIAERGLGQLVKVLALPRWFDFALVKARPGVAEDDAVADFKRLTEFSFTQQVGPGRFRLHSIMAEALQYLLYEDSLDRFTEAHKWFTEHWQSRFEAGEAETEVEAWNHRLHFRPDAAMNYWCDEAGNAVRARDAGRGRILLAWWEGIDPTTDEWRDALGDRAWATALHALGYWLDKLKWFASRHDAMLGRVIECYQAALSVYTEEAFPADWAQTQNNLGNAYGDLPTGDLGENLRRAIECYEAALKVYTEEAFPADWARTQNNLGIAFKNLPTGDEGENLRRAIGCYEAALRVRTEEAFPAAWAMTQNNLGIAFKNLPTGDRAENMERGIECYRAALRVYTEEASPADWATTQSNLGAAYNELPTGDRAENQRRAIECYEAALRVRTEEAFPADWATTQNNLGNAYRALPTGARGENLRRAIGCFEAALKVYTEEAFPQYWARTTRNLARALEELEALG